MITDTQNNVNIDAPIENAATAAIGDVAAPAATGCDDAMEALRRELEELRIAAEIREEEAYTRGRNEAIEAMRAELQHPVFTPQTHTQEGRQSFLQSLSRSVWD